MVKSISSEKIVRNSRDTAIRPSKKQYRNIGTSCTENTEKRHLLFCHEMSHALVAIALDSPPSCIACNAHEGANFRLDAEKHIQMAVALYKTKSSSMESLLLLGHALRRVHLLLLAGIAGEFVISGNCPDLSSAHHGTEDVAKSKDSMFLITHLVNRGIDSDRYLKDLAIALHTMMYPHKFLIERWGQHLAGAKILGTKAIEDLIWRDSPSITRFRADLKNAELNMPQIWNYII